MIKINGKSVIGIYKQAIPVIAVYTRGQLVWPDIDDIILSCYYNGYWIDEYPWTDDTPWTD
jgi:hypothetical protein